MMRCQRDVQAAVVRKGVTYVGGRIGAFSVSSRDATLAYALEIQPGPRRKVQTIYLDWSRSRDYYQIPVGKQLILRVGTYGNRAGSWLDSWANFQPKKVNAT